MPLYEFKCANCAAVFEKFVRSSENVSSTCPKCGGEDVKKLFSSFGFSSGGKISSSSLCSGCSSTNCSTCGK